MVKQNSKVVSPVDGFRFALCLYSDSFSNAISLLKKAMTPSYWDMSQRSIGLAFC